ncbi:MAG: YbaK/EbsC family protein [Actinobacteria bacterium]|nr:YbaK/EbsC family protein [Actinomycetota bacterium]
MAVSELPAAVARVAAHLVAAGAEARIEQLSSSCATAQEAAEAIGCTISQIVKSMVVVCDERAAVALVPGHLRVDPGRVARSVGASKGRVARAEEVLRLTGFAPGTVAPFAHGVGHVLIDQRLLAQPIVWAGAGSDVHMIALAPRELVRLTNGMTASIGATPSS